MRLYSIPLLLLFINSLCYSQKTVEDYYQKKTLIHENLQLNFLVLKEGKRGVIFYRKQKYYYWYKAQQMLVTQGGSSGVLLHGDFEAFYKSKQLAKKGDFNRGLKNGEWLYWREDGTLIRSESWRNGVKIGWEKWYDEHGDVFQTMKYRRNFSIRENNDSIIETKKNGSQKVISIKDGDNRISQIISEKNGKLHGVSKTFENGKLILIQKYNKGELISEESTVIDHGEEKDSKRKWWKILNRKEKSLKPDSKENTEKNQKEKKSNTEEKNKPKNEPKSKS